MSTTARALTLPEELRPGRRESRQTLVAIRYSHVRTELLPANPPSPRQARRNVSWSASSESSSDPSIR